MMNDDSDEDDGQWKANQTWDAKREVQEVVPELYSNPPKKWETI